MADPVGVEVRVVDGVAAGTRHRVRLAVRGRSGSPKIGLFRLGTHQVVDIPACPIHHPLINDVANQVKRAIRDARVPPYSDGRHRGTVRYLQVVVERATQTAQVVVVANGSTPDELRTLFDSMRDRLGDKLHSLFWNGNREPTNTILGPDWARICGPPWVVDRVGGVDVFYPPAAFGQSNPALAEALVEQVHAWVPSGGTVVEYYAGTGAIGLGLVERAREVRFNERNEAAMVGLQQGLRQLGVNAEQRTRYSVSTAGEAVDWLRDADVVIADPPRKGLDAALLAAIADRAPDRFIYMSCSLESFLSDVGALLSGGQVGLGALSAWVMFPFTHHVEVLALLRRRARP